MNKKIKTVNVTVIAVMAAISTVIYLIFPEIPLVPGIEYFKMDFSDIPAIAAGIILGPVSGVMVEVIKNLIHLLRSTTLGIGELINIGIGSAIIVSLSGFSRLFSRLFKKDKMSASCYYLSSIGVVIVSIFAGWLLNAILTPVYFALMGFPITASSILAGVWGSTLLNVIKAALNLLPFYPVYFAMNKAFLKISH